MYDKLFPVITKLLKYISILKPWINDLLIERIKIRHRLSILSNKDKINKEVFTKFRNKLNGQLRTAKYNYFHSEFLKFQSNGKKTWAIINNTIGKNNKYMNISLKDNEKEIKGNSVSSHFSEYFSNIPKQLISDTVSNTTDYRSYLIDRNDKSFFMSPITATELENAISQLHNSNTLLSISSAVLENIKSTISPHLTNIYNLCINQGYFPSELKIGRITPVHKKGSKYLVSNYRPICSLSPFSRILEKIVNNRMLDFIEKCNIFSPTQYGFRKGMGTEAALTNFIKYVHNSLTKELNVGAIYMDLSKAFDIMDLCILKTKLEHYGFRGIFLNFIMNYVENRNYYVYVNGYKSESKTVNIGVPQGSTLGPLLFLLFINDMHKCSSHLYFNQFADDTIIMLSSPDSTDLNSKLEIEAAKVLVWFNSNKLLINLDKTNCMLFSNKHKQTNLTIKLNDHILERVSETKYLGIIIDDKLSWKPHIKYLSVKVSKSIAILKLVKNYFPRNILRMLYMTLIYPHFNYCNIIWGSATKTTLEPLFLLQKKAVRLVNKSNYLAHTFPIFQSLFILNIHQVFKLNCLTFMYKCLKLGKFPEFKNNLIRISSSSSYNTRNHELFRLPRERLNICKFSFYVIGIKFWNELNNDIKDCVNIHAFKRKLKTISLSVNDRQDPSLHHTTLPKPSSYP